MRPGVISIPVGSAKSREVKTKDGRTVTFREQEAGLHTAAGGFPHPFTINLGPDRAPHQAGDYYLDPSCIAVSYDQYSRGRLVLARDLVLVPLKKQAAA